MTRRQFFAVVAIVVLAVLVVASPVAASSHLASPSNHTTDSDFQAATTLDNVRIDGSGSEASVALNSRYYSFEDEAADAGPPDAWEPGNFPPDAVEVSTTQAYAGSQSVNVDRGYIQLAEQPYGAPKTANVSVALYAETGTGRHTFALREEGATVTSVGINDGDLVYETGFGSFTTISTVPDANEWVDITISGIDPATNTFDVHWSTPTDSGSATGLQTQNDLTDGYTTTILGSQSGATYFDDFQIGDANGVTGSYVSATHTASRVEAGYTNLSLSGSEATVTWLPDTDNDGSFGDGQAITETYTQSGNHTTDLSGIDATEWRVNVTYESVTEQGTAELHDEGVLFDARTPNADDGSASPSGGETISSSPIELAVDVTDADFGTTQGDELNVEWYVDGEQEATTTVTSNGTATADVAVPEGGSHSWHAEITDQYGETATTGTFAFALPDELRLYEETNPDSLIETDQANVTVRFFTDGGDQVVERTPTDGTVNLGGLPVNQEFIVTVDAEGYEYRRVIVDSLVEQQDVFLLNESEPSARIIFQLDDQTGRFPSEDTRLYVERALNQSNDTTYRVIAGDRFGASGEFPVALQDDERYRLRIENDQGETRALGAYTTSGDDRAVLPIGRVTISGDATEGLAVQASLRQVPEDADVNHEYEARVFVLDAAQQTESFSLRIVDENGSVVRPESTHDGAWGRYIETYPLPGYEDGDTYYVEVNATRNGETQSYRRAIGELPDWTGDWPIDPGILALIGYVSIIAVIGFLTIWSPTIAALAGVVYAAFLTMVGIVPIPGLAIGVAGSIAVMYRLGGDV